MPAPWSHASTVALCTGSPSTTRTRVSSLKGSISVKLLVSGFGGRDGHAWGLIQSTEVFRNATKNGRMYRIATSGTHSERVLIVL